MPLLLLLALSRCVQAQEQPRIKTTVQLVLAPVTVTSPGGTPLDGLVQTDFNVTDNGRPVRHELESTRQPIALVLAIQTTAAAGPAIAKVQKIGPILQPLVAGEGGVAAVITYGHKVAVRQEFTPDTGLLTRAVNAVMPAGQGARLNDAALEAVRLFAGKPNYRRVLIVIGESKDRGSEAPLEEVVSKLQAANVTVYALTYSVYLTPFTSKGAERFGDGSRVYDPGPFDLAAVFSEIGRLGKPKSSEALTKFTGGEQLSFSKLKGLEEVLQKAGKDLHTQYLLAFQGSNEKVYHEIKVTVPGHPEALVRARPGYWPD